MMNWLKYAGTFEGVSVYESAFLGRGIRSAGLALPGLGIVLGKDAFREPKNRLLLYHEFGHFLQYRLTGFILFYLGIGIPSLLSAITRGWGRGHDLYWTEKWANHLVKNHFDQVKCLEQLLPSCDISSNTKRILLIKNA